MSAYATIEDMELLWRSMSDDEETRAAELLEIVSDRLRWEANMVRKDLDEMIEANSYLASVAKQVTVDIVARVLMTSTDAEPMTQVSESALGYSWSGTYLIPGGGLFIKDKELAALGLKRQRLGSLDLRG